MDYHLRRRLSHLLWITVWIIALVDLAWACPPSCTCTNMKDKEDETADGRPGQKVVCKSGLTSLHSLRMDLISNDTVLLDLSKNSLTVIEKDSFLRLNNLKKLDLSENQITTVEFGAFQGLASLIKLDLSKNNIGFMNGSTFAGMPDLERLNLGSNSIKTIAEGSFDVLPTLSRIDFESDQLVCDCHLQWIVKWLKSSSTKIRVSDATKCALPSDLQGKAVKTLKKKDLHCDWPVKLSLFELTPSSNQVVFQGDKLPFECRASIPDSATKMFWVREDRPLENNKSQGIYIHEQSLSDHTLIKRLVLDNLSPKHSGIWKCRVETPSGSTDKSVNIIVISEDTVYCPQFITRSNKGIYNWPKTVQGVRIDLACQNGEAKGYKGKAVAKAYHSCNSQGQWEDLDESRCQYASKVTRILEQYAEHDLTNLTKVVSKANQLNRYISNPTTLTDKMDIVYTSKIIEAFSKLARDNEKLGDIVLHIVSSLMDADANLLREAQLEEKACSRLVKAVEELPKQLLTDKNLTKKFTKNIALEAHRVVPDTFPGMTCASYRPSDPDKSNTYMEDSFSCSMQQNYTAGPVPREGQEVESSIHIPDTIFKDSRCLYQICQRDNLDYKLQVVVYKNAKLFPVLGENQNDEQLSTGVVSSKIAGVSVINTTNPVIVNLRDVTGTKGKKAVYWDFMANDGMGAWLDRGCRVVGKEGDLTEIHCTRLNHFAIMKTSSAGASQILAMFVQFFTMSVVVYIGTGILTLCMLAVIITYLCINRQLKMPRKAKHSIANLCVAIMLLFVTYALGIKSREPVIACQIIGIAIHYFSLSVLFWITIIAFFMCKKFAKAAYPPPPPTEPLDGPPPPRTVVTVYLVGWGVSIIICGISGAINWFNYAGNPDFCFLSVGAGVLCFYIPVGLLVVIDLVLFIRIACILRGSTDKTEPIEEPETEETQVNIVELADNDGSIAIAGPSRDVTTESVAATEKTHMTSASTSSSSSKMDLEYRPITQLHATIVLLFLYMLTWTAGALLVALPFPGIPHQEIIFNYLFGGLVIVLGMYVFVFYCVGRTECQTAWRQFCCCVPKVPDREPTPDTTSNLAHLPLANGHIHSGSDMEGSSYTSRSNQTNSFKYTPKKNSNINLVPSITDPSMSSIQELQQRFYNPRQNGAAKKYWEKNKQHRLLHQLNTDLYMDSGHSSQGEGRYPKRSNRESFLGNSSDANTHLSIEIQIQPKQGTVSPHSSTEQNQNIYNSLQRRQQQKSPVNLDYNKPLLTLGPLLERNQIPPVGGASSPPPLYNNIKFPYNNAHNVNIYPLLTPPHMAGIDYASSGSSHTLPKQCRDKDSKLPVKEGMQRNGSVPRLRDFDGQSAVSSEQTTQTPKVGTPDMYKPPKPIVVDYVKKEPAGRSQQATPENELPQRQSQSLEKNSNSKGSSLDKNSNSKSSHRQTDNFLDQLEQRIPQIQNSAPDKIDNISLQDNHNGEHVETVETLPPTATESHDLPGSSGRKSHRKHHRHHGKRHSRMSREPKSWDEEFKDKPPKPSVNYAFVNHDYRDRVIDKLIKTNAQTGLLEKGLLDPNMSWMPRSVSAYDHQDAGESLLDSSSTSSSDDDSEGMGEVWVLQKKKKKKFKKETSV